MVQKEIEGQSHDSHQMKPTQKSKKSASRKLVETRRSMRVLIKERAEQHKEKLDRKGYWLQRYMFYCG